MPNTFEMFQYYKNVYGGKKITDEYSMNASLLCARQYIEKLTCHDAKIDYNCETIKNCVCALCDILYDRHEQGLLEGEDYDTFSRKYKTVNWDKLIRETTELYLPAHLLYRGF